MRTCSAWPGWSRRCGPTQPIPETQAASCIGGSGRRVRQGWLIITRDSRIQHHRAELDAIRTSGARMITLASDEARGTWAQLEVLMSQWRAIERRLEEPGPFICMASRTVLREVSLS
jgi:hypothetical protein